MKDIQASYYDTFLSIAGRREPIDIESLAKTMWQDDIDLLQGYVDQLERDGLIVKVGDAYKKSDRERTSLLLQLLFIALAYDYDYNFYLQEPVLDFLVETYGVESFSKVSLEKVPEYQKLLHRLLHDKLLFFVGYKPIKMRLVRNLFLTLICEYFALKPKTKLLFDSKPNFKELILFKRNCLSQDSSLDIALGGQYIFGDGPKVIDCPLPKIQKLVAYDIMPEQPEIFDQGVKTCMERAKGKVSEYTEHLKRRLTLDIIREYHSLVVASTNTSREYRTFNVKIDSNPAFKTAKYTDIPQLMTKFMIDYNKVLSAVRNTLDVLSLCAFAYNQFLHIHPFEDGNSRTSKLIAMHIINIFNIEGLSNFPPSLDYTFINLTKGAPKRNDNDLRDLFEEMYVLVLCEQELKKMQR